MELEHGIRALPREWSFASLAAQAFSLVCLCSVKLAPSQYLHSSQPWSPPCRLTSKAWASIPSCHSLRADTVMWAASLLESATKHNLCGESSVLPSQHLSHCTVLWGSEDPLWPSLWGSLLVCRIFSSFMTPFVGTSPSPKLLCLPFHLYLLAYLIPRRLVCFLEVWGPLHMQILFSYIWGIEGGPPVLFLHHLEGPPLLFFIFLMMVIKWDRKLDFKVCNKLGIKKIRYLCT